MLNASYFYVLADLAPTISDHGLIGRPPHHASLMSFKIYCWSSLILYVTWNLFLGAARNGLFLDWLVPEVFNQLGPNSFMQLKVGMFTLPPPTNTLPS